MTKKDEGIIVFANNPADETKYSVNMGTHHN